MKRGASGGSFLAGGEGKGGVAGLAWRHMERGVGRAPAADRQWPGSSGCRWRTTSVLHGDMAGEERGWRGAGSCAIMDQLAWAGPKQTVKIFL
jgi:hypothetical protein